MGDSSLADKIKQSLLPLVSRVNHLILFAIILSAYWLTHSSWQPLAWIPTVLPLPTPAPTSTAHSAPLPRGGDLSASPANSALTFTPVLHTIIPERPRRTVITYTVQPGDNVFSIAEQFGLQPESIIWANPDLETDPDLLYIGQVLNILPVDGVYHTVEEGETLESIAKKYKSTVEAIVTCEANGFTEPPYTVQPGDQIIVPGGEKPFKPRYVQVYTGPIPEGANGTGSFVWPVSGALTQTYWKLHRAIDIAGPAGDTVVAADSGVVVYAAWNRSGYGNLVIIDHGNGFQTYYAHLSGFYVYVGDVVHKGQPIGARGSTGNSTGPHLHFEIRQNGILRNPLGFLPRP